MTIAIVLPSRGLIFAEVEQAIEAMREQCNIEVFRSWDKGIPDAQNYLIDKAIRESDPDYVLFIEEDTIPPEHALIDMLIADADIAFIDYGVNGWSCSAKEEGTGEVLWCGFGCTLVRREVFDELERPYFRTDKTLRLNDWQWVDATAKYGGQDIWFCIKAREAGFGIKQVRGECRHMQIDALGTKEVNDGRHILSQKKVIKKIQIIDKLNKEE